ncbi:MAG: hypothetical protein LIO78_10540 [Clostridiales bacterium]|nr:hypothetical protein [Clostridiales bacterium]
MYFVSETVYSFTVEVYTDADCSGDPVATETFGSDAAYIEPTNSDNAVWLRNRSVSISLDDGTYYVRCKADGNSDDQVEDSEYSEVQEVTVSSTETDVNYFVATYDPETGTLASTDGSVLEFGNGSTFSSFTITDDADTVAEDDLYTFNGEANCDMHLTGSEGETSGEAYTNGPRLMPIDKPDLRGTWELNDDGTITVKIMADYQYYVDEADKKTS